MVLRNWGDFGKNQAVSSAALTGGLNGDAFTAVNVISSAPNFDGRRAHGEGSYRFNFVNLANNPYMEWSGLSLGFAYLRLYFLQDANTPSDLKLIQFNSTASNRGGVEVNTDGTLSIVDSSNVTVSTSTATITNGVWNRLELWIDWETGTNTLAELRMYIGESTTPVETITTPVFNTNGASASLARFGKVNSTSFTHTFWIDTIELNDTGWPGPANAGTVLAPNTGHLSRPGNIALGVIEAFEDVAGGDIFTKTGLGIIGP